MVSGSISAGSGSLVVSELRHRSSRILEHGRPSGLRSPWELRLEVHCGHCVAFSGTAEHDEGNSSWVAPRPRNRFTCLTVAIYPLQPVSARMAAADVVTGSGARRRLHGSSAVPATRPVSDLCCSSPLTALTSDCRKSLNVFRPSAYSGCSRFTCCRMAGVGS